MHGLKKKFKKKNVTKGLELSHQSEFQNENNNLKRIFLKLKKIIKILQLIT